MRLLMKTIASGQSTLGGAVEGRRHLAMLVDAWGEEPAQPEPLFLDYAGIDFATASYHRETLIALQTLIRSRRSNHYIVVANAVPAVREDIEVLARFGGIAFLTCALDEAENVSDVGLIGNLDPKQRSTFDEVCARGETDARELMAASAGQDSVGQTAFNNRLASLVNMGLIAEISQGKAKRYRPVLQGHADGK